MWRVRAEHDLGRSISPGSTPHFGSGKSAFRGHTPHAPAQQPLVPPSSLQSLLAPSLPAATACGGSAPLKDARVLVPGRARGPGEEGAGFTPAPQHSPRPGQATPRSLRAANVRARPGPARSCSRPRPGRAQALLRGAGGSAATLPAPALRPGRAGPGERSPDPGRARLRGTDKARGGGGGGRRAAIGGAARQFAPLLGSGDTALQPSAARAVHCPRGSPRPRSPGPAQHSATAARRSRKLSSERAGPRASPRAGPGRCRMGARPPPPRLVQRRAPAGQRGAAARREIVSTANKKKSDT